MQVTDQDLDVWPNSPACVSDALRHYYYQYLSSTTEAAEVVPVTSASCSQVNLKTVLINIKNPFYFSRFSIKATVKDSS